ncbi:hypothetical protein R80B4_00300 [Fibrobacteres bacterium R8-0-B4]
MFKVKSIGVVVAIVAVVVALGACVPGASGRVFSEKDIKPEGPPADENTHPQELIGVWEKQSGSCGGPTDVMMQFRKDGLMIMTYTAPSDGEFKMYQKTWFADGNRLEVQWLSPLNYVVEGGVLTIRTTSTDGMKTCVEKYALNTKMK